MGFARQPSFWVCMMWRKQSLKENAVIPVLWLHTLLFTLMLPFTLLSAKTGALDGSILCPHRRRPSAQVYLSESSHCPSSLVFGYFGMKHCQSPCSGHQCHTSHNSPAGRSAHLRRDLISSVDKVIMASSPSTMLSRRQKGGDKLCP